MTVKNRIKNYNNCRFYRAKYYWDTLRHQNEGVYWQIPTTHSEHLSMIEAGKYNFQFHPLTFKKRRQKGVQMDDFKSNHHSEISQRHAVE